MNVTCPNRECPLHGTAGRGNIVGNGTYKAGGDTVRKFLCRECGRTFNSRTGTIYEGIRTSTDKMDEALELIRSGLTVKKAAEKVGASPVTVKRWHSAATVAAQMPHIFDNVENSRKVDFLMDDIIGDNMAGSIPRSLIHLPVKIGKLVRLCTENAVCGLGIRSYHLLFIMGIGKHPHLTRKRLSELLPVDRTKASVVLRELINMGFVARDTSARNSPVSLTPKGQETYEGCRKISKGAYERLFGSFTKEEISHLEASLLHLDAQLTQLTDELAAGKDETQQ